MRAEPPRGVDEVQARCRRRQIIVLCFPTVIERGLPFYYFTEYNGAPYHLHLLERSPAGFRIRIHVGVSADGMGNYEGVNCMLLVRRTILGILCLTALASAQTAEELVTKNIQARGGMDKIKAVNTVQMKGKIYVQGINAEVGQEQKRPDMIRQNFTLQGMTQVQAYDGNAAWQIQPFGGKKDPELMGDDDSRDLIEQADIDGPLVDYQAKGNKVEYLGHDTVDGDDAYKLKVTLKNGDILYYYLDPDTYLEIRTEKQQFIRGSVRETEQDLGSYKQVAGVYYPFSVEGGTKNSPNDHVRITFEKIEVNVPIDDSTFKMPALKK